LITITEEIAVPSPPERVWAVVSDPATVVGCIDGAELGTAHDDGSFDGSLAVKFGGVRVRFAARVTLDLVESELSGTISARGRDGQGATRFTGGARFQVGPGGANASRVVVRGEVGITGKLASLIESGANAMVRRMTRDFAAQLIQRCTEPDLAAPDAVAPVRPGPLARFRAWVTRLLQRRSENPAPSVIEGVGSGTAE